MGYNPAHRADDGGEKAVPENIPRMLLPLDDLEALTWLRSQPEGRVAVNAAKLGRQWDWNRMRTSWRLKVWTPAVMEDMAAVTEATRMSRAERARRLGAGWLVEPWLAG
jgi:hypothetical protein